MIWKLNTKNARKRAFVWTLFNYTDEMTAELMAHAETHGWYLVFGYETCPSTGKKHLQGFCYLPDAKTQTAIGKFFPHETRGEWAVDNDTTGSKTGYKEAIEYCMKEGDFVEVNRDKRPKGVKERGELGRTKGSELYRQAIDLAEQGRVEEVDPKLRLVYYSALTKIADKALAGAVFPKTIPFDFWWFYGPAGTGKSQTAKQRYPNAFVKNWSKWWDGYCGEEVVIIEEVSPLPPHEMHALCRMIKLLCDNGPLTVEVKNGMLKIRPMCVIFTSNYDIEELWFTSQERDPLLRRLKRLHFTHVARDLDDIRAPAWEPLTKGDGGPPEVVKVAKAPKRRIVEVDYRDHSKVVDLSQPDTPEEVVVVPRTPPVHNDTPRPTRAEVELAQGRHTFGSFRTKETKLDSAEFSSDETESFDGPTMRARKRAREQERLDLERKVRAERLASKKAELPLIMAAQAKAIEERDKRMAKAAAEKAEQARVFSQMDTQLLSQRPITQEPDDETFTGPVPLRRTAALALSAVEVSDAAAALLELQDGDSEPSQGESLGSQDSKGPRGPPSEYAGTNSEIDSDEELGPRREDVSSDGDEQHTSDDESLF